MENTEKLNTGYQKEIIVVESELISALKNGNLETMDRLLHDDLLFTIPDGEVITKAQDLDSYSSGRMAVEDMVPSEQRIQIVGDNAVVSVKINLKAQYMGHKVEDDFRFTRVWKLFDKQWKVIAGSSVKIMN